MLEIERRFQRSKSKKRVAEFLLKNAVRIESDGRLFCRELEIPYSSVAKVVGVDRRVVKSTAESILADEHLRAVFSKLDSVLLLRDVAPDLGYGAIEIIPTDAASEGILAGVARIITDSGLSIRQMISEDPMFPGAETTVITEKPLPRALIDEILRVEGVKKVIVLS